MVGHLQEDGELEVDNLLDTFSRRKLEIDVYLPKRGSLGLGSFSSSSERKRSSFSWACKDTLQPDK